MATILFTSTARADDIGLAMPFAQTLRQDGRFTVVTIGDNVFDAITNSNFSDFIINWTRGAFPPNYQTNFPIAYMCMKVYVSTKQTIFLGSSVPTTTGTQIQTVKIIRLCESLFRQLPLQLQGQQQLSTHY